MSCAFVDDAASAVMGDVGASLLARRFRPVPELFRSLKGCGPTRLVLDYDNGKETSDTRVTGITLEGVRLRVVVSLVSWPFGPSGVEIQPDEYSSAAFWAFVHENACSP
jgi:hypothetical protein